MRWPAFAQSMAVRVFVVLAVGMSLAASVGFLVADQDRRHLLQKRHVDQIADRMVDISIRLSGAPAAAIDDQTPPVIPPAGVADIPIPVIGHDKDDAVDAVLKSRLADTRLGDLTVLRPHQGECNDAPPPPGKPVVGPPMPRPLPPPHLAGLPDCRLLLFLRDGETVRALMVPVPPMPDERTEPTELVLFYVLIVASFALAYVVAAISTAPIRKLARAATNLGENLDRPPLEMEGPWEVKQAAAAFNAMQAKVQRTMQDRTFMLAAITHDLQTPLTRQRLRIDRLTDAYLREQMLEDYQVMRDLIRDGLEIARGATRPVELQPLDLASLLESICEDAVAAGQDVAILETVRATILCDPLSLQRCLVNLVENAVKYGQRARLTARPVGDEIEVVVLDDGPGIDVTQIGAALQPFVRLDGDAPHLGSGLGLAIAEILAARNQSKLTLTNLPTGGLSASVRLRRVNDPTGANPEL